MGENLVIVESPAKAKTIEKFLGKGFTVASSFGHIRDLSKKNLGIDIDNGFEPCYEVSADKKKVVADLKKLASKAKTVWLASDEDREGEAIAWHLQQTLNLDDAKTNRIVFHEITKPAILEAIENPRGVDLNLVMAQQARRVLDRLVGFELSPILWKKVAPKLSAGRVQSVAVRLIVEREREISSFVATPYYKISGLFHPQSNGKKLKIKALCNEKMESRERALDLLERCKGADFRIETIQKHTISRTPAPPFTTSALQQEAARKLGIKRELIARHPFPGPGLAIRLLGEITREKLEILKEADKIYIDSLCSYMTDMPAASNGFSSASNAAAAGKENLIRLYDAIWQAGTILLPVKSVGVMGDERTYEYTIALRAVTSNDGMTADWVHLPYDFLAKVSNDIINKVKGVNRVVYDISSKPPATIEWE